MASDNKTFWNRSWFQVLVGVVVTSGLLVVWFIEYAEPIITAKSELAVVRAEIALNQAKLQESINKLQEQKTREAVDGLQLEKDKLSVKIKKLEYEQKIITQDFQSDQKQKQRLISRYEKQLKELKPNAETPSQSKKLTEEIEDLLKNTQDKADNQRAKYEAERKEFEKRHTQLKNLEDQITELSLSGIWHQQDSSIDGNDVYIEFLPSNKTRTYWGSESVSFSNKRWEVKDNFLIIETKFDGKIHTERGVLRDDTIEFAVTTQHGVFPRQTYKKISEELEAKLRLNNPKKKSWFSRTFGK